MKTGPLNERAPARTSCSRALAFAWADTSCWPPPSSYLCFPPPRCNGRSALRQLFLSYLGAFAVGDSCTPGRLELPGLLARPLKLMPNISFRRPTALRMRFYDHCARPHSHRPDERVRTHSNLPAADYPDAVNYTTGESVVTGVVLSPTSDSRDAAGHGSRHPRVGNACLGDDRVRQPLTPVPTPSSKRPRLSRSIVTASLAIIACGRHRSPRGLIPLRWTAATATRFADASAVGLPTGSFGYCSATIGSGVIDGVTRRSVGHWRRSQLHRS